jgi:hypothetical protein
MNAQRSADVNRWSRLARRGRAAVAVAAVSLLVTALGGCALGQLVGGMAESARRAGSTEVKAKYRGLENKTFAVVVAADRSIQADFPDVVAVLTAEVTRRVSEHTGAGVVPPEDVLRFQGRRPGWVAMSPRELAGALGVERLIYIDLHEYALTDPGNRYVWKGVASGIVGVVEPDNTYGDDFAFRESVQVKFPDRENTGPMEIPESTVQQALLLRFINRCSWLFFDHEESNVIEY